MTRDYCAVLTMLQVWTGLDQVGLCLEAPQDEVMHYNSEMKSVKTMILFIEQFNQCKDVKLKVLNVFSCRIFYEQHHKKTWFLHMRKQRHRSAAW